MKYFITPFLSVIVMTAAAQVQQGTWNIGTSTNAPMNLQLSSNGPGFKSYNFSFNPTAGYFFRNRWEVGGGPVLSFTGSKYKDNFGVTGIKNNQNSFGVNVYSRYYLKSEGKLLPYLTANAMYLRTAGLSTDLSGIKSSYKINEWRVGAGAGLSWFITPKAALFTELTYDGSWGGGMGYTNGLNLKVGFQIYLGRKSGRKK
jgi:hypothetical protein